ncbi:MAG TPA: SBBP repeat-containing protein [Candidatus Angelobacter sp.]
MLKPLRSATLCFLLSAILSFAAESPATSPSVSIPFAIEINHGQTAPQVKYLARSPEGVLFFTDQGVTVSVPRVGAFRMLFDGAAAPEISAEQKMIARSNYLEHKGHSITNIENYGALRYSGIYPGIDVRFYGSGRHLEHDFVLAPGANANQIALRFEGIDHVAISPSGNAELSLGKVVLGETQPIAWQTTNGKLNAIEAHWKMMGDARLGITLGEYDHSRPVTIDPVLAYSTHLGGATGNDIDTGTSFPADTAIVNIGIDAQRNVYVSGTTSAADYPTTAGAFDRTANIQSVFHEDATTQSGFVSKFDPTGKILIYSTFLRVSVERMAVDPAGHVYSAEEQFIEDPGPNFSFDEGIHLDKLSVDGSHLLFSTMFAQTFDSSAACQAFSSSFPTDLAVDNSGHVWMVGDTVNPCMPATPGAFQTKMPNTNGNGFVAKFDTTKPVATALVYATYISASTNTSGMSSVGIDSAGNAYLAGTTSATNFPHGASFGSGGAAMFAAKLNPTGSGLLFSTLIHGATSVSLALDSSHNIYLAGQAVSGFPTTTGAFRRTVTGTNCHDFVGNAIQCADGFVTKLSPGGGTLLYSTFLGGSNDDTITDISLNSARMAFVTGFTNSTDFPTTASAFKKSIPAGVVNSFVTALQPDGKSLYYSTLLGGSHSTKAGSIVVDPAWNAWVGGNTSDTDYPVTSNAFQPGMKGESDGFFAKIVIAGDLRATLIPATATALHNSVVTFTATVTNLGPDGSDAVVLTDVIPSGFSFSGISGSTATSCTVPAIGATSGSVVCHKTRLENGQSFGVKILLKAIAAAGSTRVNKITTSARTQDLHTANNSAQSTVFVH